MNAIMGIFVGIYKGYFSIAGLIMRSLGIENNFGTAIIIGFFLGILFITLNVILFGKFFFFILSKLNIKNHKFDRIITVCATLGIIIFYFVSINLYQDCDRHSSLNVNGVSNYIYSDYCHKKGKIDYTPSIPSIPVSQEKIYPKVDLKVNGSDNPSPIRYNSVFTLDYNISGDVSCYPYGGPVPATNPAYNNGWSDRGFVTWPNFSTSTKLIARDSNKGYVSSIKLTMKCGEEQNTVVEDTIIIPIER